MKIELNDLIIARFFRFLCFLFLIGMALLAYGWENDVNIEAWDTLKITWLLMINTVFIMAIFCWVGWFVFSTCSNMAKLEKIVKEGAAHEDKD